MVHWQDPEGTLKKVEMVKKYFSEFGVATECGMGRKKPEELEPILKLSKEAAQQVYA